MGTFGSTPVVSIRNGKRNSETEESYSEEKMQNNQNNPSFAPSPILPNTQFRGFTHAASPPAPNYLQATPSPQPPPQQAAAQPAPQPKPCPVEMPPVPTYVSSQPKPVIIKSETPKPVPAPQVKPSPTPTHPPSQDKAQSEPVKHIKQATVAS